MRFGESGANPSAGLAPDDAGETGGVGKPATTDRRAPVAYAYAYACACRWWRRFTCSAAPDARRLALTPPPTGP